MEKLKIEKVKELLLKGCSFETIMKELNIGEKDFYKEVKLKSEYLKDICWKKGDKNDIKI